MPAWWKQCASMPQNKVWILLSMAFVIVGMTVLFWSTVSSRVLAEEPHGSREFVTIRLADQEFEVVLAKTREEIQQGLSYRRSIGADGMLFVMPGRDRFEFWMYEMQFPLDFLWIDQGSVVDLDTNIPAPVSRRQDAIVRVAPDVPVRYALEVPAGFVREHGIEVGSPFQIVSDAVQRDW